MLLVVNGALKSVSSLSQSSAFWDEVAEGVPEAYQPLPATASRCPVMLVVGDQAPHEDAVVSREFCGG